MKTGLYLLAAFFLYLVPTTIRAEQAQTCLPQDRPCILKLLEKTAETLPNGPSRDQTLRELAKTLAFDRQYDSALTLLPKINSADTQALTIRGIGMAAAEHQAEPAIIKPLFEKLLAHSQTMTDAPARAIALTYIAMAQAVAGDDDGAIQTSQSMDNDSLRHKAYGETAEIQAKKGKGALALVTLSRIESIPYRNKALLTVSGLLAQGADFENALKAALLIDNAYLQALALQNYLDIRQPREVEK